MSVVSFKVKREIKERMEKFKDKINWAEELRRFVVKKIESLKPESAWRWSSGSSRKYPSMLHRASQRLP